VNRIGWIGIFLIALIGCSDIREKTNEVSKTMAIVNGHPVSIDRLNYQLNKEGASQSDEDSTETLENLTRRIALADKARALGLGTDPLVQEIIEGILISRLRETVLFPKIDAIQIDDAMIAEYYRSNLKNYTRKEQFKVAVLWFDTRGQAPLELRFRERLTEAREIVLAESIPIEEGFGSLAIKNTEHLASRYKGGVLGWLETGDYSDSFRKNALEIATQLNTPGEISDLVVSDAGSFVVRLLERRPESVIPLSKVSATIEAELKKTTRETMEKQFEAEMLKDAQIEIY
jgi:hypothetical protein